MIMRDDDISIQEASQLVFERYCHRHQRSDCVVFYITCNSMHWSSFGRGARIARAILYVHAWMYSLIFNPLGCSLYLGK